ncbi:MULTISPECIES: hypothetical protein [Flavobacteriaceae]|jgi:hypothetical protein|uniref:Secreted protein (Por secretion system target) n=2 Tax=Flavobacteriaceae TaxID=49546 RepID=A0ABN1JEI3_9FLAO|nr:MULTISPECIES: hypothetical protein [Flavobacteriaceae]RYH76122.1 hypothetical protein EVU94_03950 [Flavobacteriaceae bacterium 144Ye]TBV28196.1 hypothetical protein DMZ43_03915 [Meridianimaribacter sp. CL38]TDY13673.1 hypothetical protein A8975_0266 [Meridianimaribacter flavus]
MKKAIKNSIVMVAIIAAMVTNANATATLIVGKEKKTMLALDDVKQGQQLLIKDVNGIILYKETINATGTYNNLFDLTQLPNGDYFFELNKDVEINVIPFKVVENRVEFNKSLESKVFKPILRMEDNRLFVSKFSLNNAPLSLEIHYANNEATHKDFELIYSENIDSTSQIFERVYKLMKGNTGDYKVVIKTDGREFTQTVKMI